MEPDWATLPQDDRLAKREAQNKNSFIIYHMQSALDKRLFPWISSCNIAKDAWKVLKDGFQGNDQVKPVRLQTMKTKFENLKQEEDDKVGEYFVKVNTCVQMMEILGEEISNSIIVKKVLGIVLPKWTQTAIMFEETKHMSTLTLDQLIGSLMSHD